MLRAANKQKDDTRAISLGETVLSAALQDARSVTNSALLAVAVAIPWSRLSKGKRDELSRFENLIESGIAQAISAGSDQSYQAFGAMGRQWSWRDPERFRRVYELLPPRSLAEMPETGERFVYADILREAAEGAGYDEVERARLRADSVALFESMEHQTEYQRTRHGRLLVEMERFEQAIEKLSFEPKGGKEFQRYWLSKAQFGAGRGDAALAAIDEAIQIAPEDSNFLSTFLSHRFEVRRAKKDPAAIEDLDEAIAQAEGKHRRALEARRAEVLGSDGR